MKIIKQTGKIMVVVLIIAVLTIPISAFAATLKRGNDFWYSTGNVSGETFAVDGNTAYCVNPLQPIPGNGNYTPTQLNNDSLMKVLYYGYGGIGFNNTIKAKMDSYHNNQNINVTGKDLYYGLTRRCAAKAYGSNYKFSYYADWNNAIDNFYAYVQALPKPSGCKVYIINQNNTTQAIAYLVEDEKIILQLQKQSSNTSISNNNACYSLAGAVYGIFTDAACTKKVGEITTNANGFAAYNKSVYIGTYYAKEITAPKGFALSREVLTFKKTNGTDSATGLNVYKATALENPKNDPVNIVLRKESKNGKALAGAEFTINYYDTLDDVTGKGDTMKRRQKDLFKLPNSIFTADLTPTQFKVIAALYSLRSRSIYKGNKYIKISQKSLKKICGIKSTQTISDAANALCRLGYIKRIDRYYDDYKKLGTYVYTLPVVTGRDFFFVSRLFLKYELTAAQTRMYLFFCKCADSASRWFWNSYNDIRAALKLKRSAVIQTVRELCSMGLIKKRSVKKKDGSLSDNHYKVVTLKPPKRKIRQKKGRSCLALSFFQLSKCVKLFYKTPKAHWVVKTDADGYAGLDQANLVEGSAFYHTGSGNPCIPIGTVTIQETKAPAGYVIDNELHIFKITDEGSATDTEFVETFNMPTLKNDPFTVSLDKKDESGKLLAGAQVQLLDSSKKVVAEWTTTAEPYVISEELVVGETYTYHEVKAPDGYKTADDITFTFEGNKNLNISMTDFKTETHITKTDIQSAYSDDVLEANQAILSVINSDRYVSGDFDFEDYKGEFEDKSIPFFGNTNDINAILLSTPHLKATKDEIAAYFIAEHDEQKRVDYIKSIFNHDFTEVIIPDGRRMGYKAYRSVLHLWTGGYGDRTSQSFYQWRTVAAHFEGMRLLGELRDTAKPQQNQEGQLELVPGFSGEEKPAFVFTQEIIDAVLTRGSGVSQSKMRIYRQYQTPFTQSERISFLKNEYGWGGSYPVITGTGIDENHDGKGIHLQRGFADDAPKLLLKWSQVEQRIGELIRADQYLSPTQKALYPEWFEREEARESGVRIDVEGLPPVIEPEPIEPKEPVEETPESETTVAEQNDTLNDRLWQTYSQAKADSADRIVIIHVGEYFEVMGADAERIAAEFDVTFGKRILSNGESVSVFGYPAQQAQLFSDMLMDRGHDLAFVREDNGELKQFHLNSDSKENPVSSSLIAKVEYLDKSGKVEVISSSGGIPTEEETVGAEELSQDIAEAENFVITDNNIGVGTPSQRYQNNVNAIKTLHELKAENRLPTPAEQKTLSQYVGWGGLSDNLRPGSTHSYELHELLSQEEYRAACDSVLTAFYTPPVVVKSIYKALNNMGFTNGTILDPACGTGHFFGLLPDYLRGKVTLHGIEIDKISGEIAQMLYPNANIKVQGYEETKIPDNYLDVIVGNVPFVDYTVFDKAYNKHHLMIHDYFFVKSLDKVRPGGIIAFITSTGTMDKHNPIVRELLAEKADLIGAIRLPNNTFKAAAGTDVSSDIIFLQKRTSTELLRQYPDWCYTVKYDDEREINSYFAAHPEMICGKLDLKSSRFGGMDVVCVPNEDTSLADELNRAIQNIQGTYVPYTAANETDEEGLYL